MKHVASQNRVLDGIAPICFFEAICDNHTKSITKILGWCFRYFEIDSSYWQSIADLAGEMTVKLQGCLARLAGDTDLHAQHTLLEICATLKIHFTFAAKPARLGTQFVG